MLSRRALKRRRTTTARWKAKHRDRQRAYERAYREKNREAINARRRMHRAWRARAALRAQWARNSQAYRDRKAALRLLTQRRFLS